MKDLIARLQKATGPDRSLDVEIGCLQGVLVGKQDQETGEVRDFTYHRYTESIDSALTLVPQNYWWLLGAGQIKPEEPLYAAQIRKPGFSTGGQIVSDAEHDVMAIALCIAALKARDHIKPAATKEE